MFDETAQLLQGGWAELVPPLTACGGQSAIYGIQVRSEMAAWQQPILAH